MQPPNLDNLYHAAHIEQLCSSLLHWSGRVLDHAEEPLERAHNLYYAPFALLSHDSGPEPLLTYANLSAQRLFGMEWEEIIGLPSRETAEADRREARAEALQRVAEQGYIDGYSGIRIAKGGQRFRIEQVTLWNLRDARGDYAGQAALIEAWSEWA